MKLLNALQDVIKTPENSSTVDSEGLLNSLGMNYEVLNWDKYEKGLVAYWVISRYCTDSYVGLQAIYLNGELVAYSQQEGRKCDYEVTFLNIEAAKAVKDFVVSCMETHEDEFEVATAEDLEQDIDEKVSWWCSEFLLPGDHKGVWRKGLGTPIPVTFLKTVREKGEYNSKQYLVKVDEDGQKLTIPAEEYFFPIRVKLGMEIMLYKMSPWYCGGIPIRKESLLNNVTGP